MVMGPCTAGRVTATHTFNVDSSISSPRAVGCGLSSIKSSSTPLSPCSVPQKLTCRTHSTHNFSFVSHHMYTTVKHLSACLINTDTNLMQHASLPLAVEGKASRASAACSSRARPTAPHPALTTTCFSYRSTLGGVALVNQARSGMVWHDMYCSLQAEDSTRAFRAVSSTQPPSTCLPAGSHPQLARSSCLEEHATGRLCFRTAILLAQDGKKISGEMI
jgi:hypothetical protein